ncbi:hypothetical protein [Ideonella sp.]|uniref:hypothetical protein n=1 Tax=Ideonella sp. TaxID=1929293 RepID=UPI003BB7E3F4
MLKKLLALSMLALAALSTHQTAMAHGGGQAKHGGVVATASDLTFELVASPDGAMIYVEDHGKPMAPTGLKGKLTVLNGAEKSEAELMVAGDKLEARGLKLAKGAKVVAALMTPNAKAITVRFTVK